MHERVGQFAPYSFSKVGIDPSPLAGDSFRPRAFDSALVLVLAVEEACKIADSADGDAALSTASPT